MALGTKYFVEVVLLKICLGREDHFMLQGKVVVITGAAKGIGRYAARTFAQAGAKLGIIDIDAQRLQKVSEELRQMGAEVLPEYGDVSNEDEVHRMVNGVVSRFGSVDVLLNDAAVVTHFGWEQRWARIADMDKGFWDRVIQTNLGGTFLCTKHVLPHMEKRRSGHIINLHGGGHGVGACAYVVSKEAIRTFTQFVAEEEREWGICAVAIAPGGAIATEDAPDSVHQQMAGLDTLGNRFVLAAEVGMEMTGQLLTFNKGRLEIRQ